MLNSKQNKRMEKRFVDQKINSKTNLQIHNKKIEVISSFSYRSTFGSQSID